MADVDGLSETPAVLTTARAFVYIFDKAKGQWSGVSGRTYCRLQLLIHGGNYRVVGTSEFSSEVSAIRVVDQLLSGSVQRALLRCFLVGIMFDRNLSCLLSS